MKEGWNKLCKEYNSHIAYPLFLIIFVFFILIFWTCRSFLSVMVDQVYDDNVKSQIAMSTAMQDNIEMKLDEYIENGAQVSIDFDVYEAVSNYYYGYESKEKYENELSQMIVELGGYSSEIEGILICTEKDIIMEYQGGKRVNIQDSIIEDNSYIGTIIQSAKSQIPRCEMHISDELTGEIALDIIYPIKNAENYNETVFYIVITYNVEKILELLSQQESYEYISTYIIDAHTDTVLTTTISKQRMESDDNEVIISQSLDEESWVFNMLLNTEILKNDIQEIYSYMSTLLVIIFIVLVFLLFVLLRYILEPVSQIHEFSVNVKAGDMNQKLEIKGSHELWLLGEEFNEMLASIQKRNQEEKEYNKKILKYMDMKRIAEKEALESQINAHFICNTLNVINYEAIESGEYKISILLRRLSDMLRYSFEWQEKVCLEEELNWVETYLYLQKERSGDVFDYHFNVDTTCVKLPCTKLMLQPFVENAVIHGFKGVQEGGRITINVYREDDKIIIEIIDNGVGISLEDSARIKHYFEDDITIRSKRKIKKGIGISNVYARLRMFYGEEFKLELLADKEKETKFRFYIADKGGVS